MEVEERNLDDVKKLTQEFAGRFINLQKEKKALDANVKELKEEYKMNGVDVSKAVKAINNIKKKLKQSALDAEDERIIEGYIVDSDELNLAINDLVLGTV